MLVVIALGGNALLRRGEPAEASVQRRHIEDAAAAIAAVAAEYDVVVTHGNGPQIGLLALQAAAYGEIAPYPLDVLGAQSEGMIGYQLAQALHNRLADREVVAVLTQVIVDADDPAFATPTKPIGPIYDQATASRLARAHGWSVAADGGNFRRVVPSPEPHDLVEIESVRELVQARAIVICAGGGGIPVTCAADRTLIGVEAVVDKDLTAALLAERLHADTLLILTDVKAVERDWGTRQAQPIRHATPNELRLLDFASGSMAPKIAAACRFVERTGGTAAIGALEDAAEILKGARGTLVAPAIQTAALAAG